MVSPITKIQYADLAALATLANAKLAPATPYAFNALAAPNEITLPDALFATPTYGGAGQFPDGSKVTIRLYAYKTIGGVKKYTGTFLRKAFTGTPGAGAFSMTWNWAAVLGPTKPDGYIAAIALPSSTTIPWIDHTVELLSEDGSFSDPAWKFDATLEANNFGSPAQNLPCGRGTWLKSLNTIWKDLFAGFDVFGGSAFALNDAKKVSGPWIVSAGPKCYLKLNGFSLYKNLKFLYSEAESIIGNQLAPEADMFTTYIGVNNGANNFNWDANVKVNGRIMIFAAEGEDLANWTVTMSHLGITFSFDPEYLDVDYPGGRMVTAFIFDFQDVQYALGTPIVLTVTPLAGGSVIEPGNPAGGGGLVSCIFTGDAVTYGTANTTAIHPGGGAIAPGTAKAASIPSTLAAITFYASTVGGVAVLESHHRAFCDGVYQANTLPTPGVFPFVDVDLPQYQIYGAASSRRVARKASLPYQAVMDNLGCLYPVARDTDYAPDLVAGRPVNGSLAWQRFLASKYADTETSADSVPSYATSGHLFLDFKFVSLGAVDVRFLVDNPGLAIYAKANSAPTLSDYDITGPGGGWISLKDSLPGFAKGTTWFIGLYNPTDQTITANLTVVEITSEDPPTGTFFPTELDRDGNALPTIEGYSYHPAPVNKDDPENPIPLRGYCIHKITVRRKPVKNDAGIAVSPSTGTAALDVKIGLMKDFSFDSAGVFTELQTITIPAGSASVTVDVFLPVLKGTPLAYQCDEIAIVLAAVNYQPIMHSSFFPDTSASVINPAHNTGRHDGPLWDFSARALLFFTNGDLTKPIELPIAAAVYNDLTALLNLL